MPVDFIEEVEPTSIDFVEELPAPTLRGPIEPSIRSTIAGGPTVQTMPFTESIQEPVETAGRMIGSTEPAIPFTKLIPSAETPTTLAERGLALAIPGGAVASALYGPEVPVAGIRSLARGVLSVPEFLTSPFGISTAGVASLGKVAQTLVSLGFSADMAKSLYQQGAANIKNWGTMTPAEKTDALVSMAQTAGFAGAAGVHGVKGAVGLIPKRPVEPVAVPPVEPPLIPKTPPPLPRLAETPDVETALRQPEGAEAFTEIDKEIARAKNISPPAPEPQPTKPTTAQTPEVAVGDIAKLEKQRLETISELEDYEPAMTAEEAQRIGHPEMEGQKPWSDEPRAELLRQEISDINKKIYDIEQSKPTQPAPEVAGGEKIVAPETTIPEPPKEMFHGTRTAGTLKIGQGKNLNTQGLWLSDYESKASEFSEGRPSDEGIASVRSVEFTPSKTKKVYGPDLKHTDANDLIKQGYDSVYVPDTGFWIALKESAFKEKQPTQPKAEYAAEKIIEQESVQPERERIDALRPTAEAGVSNSLRAATEGKAQEKAPEVLLKEPPSPKPKKAWEMTREEYAKDIRSKPYLAPSVFTRGKAIVESAKDTASKLIERAKTGKAFTPEEIHAIADDLGFTIAPEKAYLIGTAAGESGAGKVSLRSRMMQGGKVKPEFVGTVIHEIGHELIHQKSGMKPWELEKGQPLVRGEWLEVQKMSRRDNLPWNKNRKYYTQQTERYARLFDLYMTRNAELKSRAPKLYSKIESLIADSAPSIVRMREVYKPHYATRESTESLAHKYAIKAAIEEGKPVPPEVLKDYPDLQFKSQPQSKPAERGGGVQKAQAKVSQVAKTEGVRNAKEIKSELVLRLEDAIQKAPSVLDERPKGVPDKITIEIPDDGTFTVFNSKEVIQRLLNRASRIETTPYKSEPQKPKRHLNPMGEAKDRILAEKRDAAENLRAIKDVHGETTRGYRAAQEMGIKAPKEWLKTPDEPTQPPPEVGEKPIGLGGAVPEEFSRTGSPTANKNAVIDAEAIRRGEKPLMAAIKQTWGDVASQAEGMVDRDPGLPQRLVDELLAKPRVLTPQEHVVLLRHRVDLRYEYHKAAREAAQAVADGRTQDAAADTIRTNEWSEKLSDLDKAIGRGGAGTEAGRSLQIRRMMMNEDYTLANLELQKRADNGFRMLTPDERAQLQKIAADYKAKADALEKHLAEKSTRIAALEAEAEMQRIKAESVPKGPSYDKRILDYAERIVTSMESQADAALARIKARGRMGKVGSGPLHELPNIADYAIVGSARLARFGVDIAKWTDSMIRDLGEEIRPHLPRILELSNGLLDEKLKKVPAAVVNAVRKVTPQEAKAQMVGKISAKIKGGKKQEISFMVQKLARQLYEEGIHEREPMVDALHQLLPEMSREEVRDAFSGYGDYKQLSKDEITVALRGMKGELQQIAKLEAMAKGEPPLKSGLERRTPTEAERKLIKEVNDAKYKFQVPSDDPNTQLQSALDTLKKTLRNRITDYTDKLAKGEFEKKPRRQVVMDDEAIRLKAQVERIKKDWEIAREKDRLARRQGWQKFADGFVRWERNFKLSSPVVFGKLSAAALTRLVTTTAEEAVGAGISKVLPKLAEKAPREGGFNAKAMSIAIRRAFSKGLNDAAQTAKTGAADVDVTYGDKIVDKDWANVFGRLHGMMKAPIKRAEIELSFQKRVEHAIRNGIDPTDPMVEARLMAEALNDGYRSIFMQRGFSSDTFNQLVSMMERNKNYPVAGELSARFARFMLPVVRVPINIVAETATGVHGTATASARLLWHATHEGLANLDPVVADSIMRQFKKGSIGLGLMAIGFLNPEHIGGYDWRDKRKPEDPKTGGFRIFGVNVPRWATHAPWFELLQFGATIRRTMDKHIAKEGAPQAISNGMWAAGLGLIEETPFVGNMLRVDKLFQSPAERIRYLAELAKGTLIPQAIQWSAGQMDKPVPFSPLEEPAKRKPKTFMEHMKMGLPMMRQQVPENQARQSKAALIP